ncbi:hypothetical protein Csa_013869 [Cucumis sativus]|uniref:Uncharacterized protein n=1 Tax=Cucumis sativus TaxID=3659 RepID=A0A0A0LTQ1_CUCSA|nr:hypothetical protein Csa_013869 [Cucumis sativus]
MNNGESKIVGKPKDRFLVNRDHQSPISSGLSVFSFARRFPLFPNCNHLRLLLFVSLFLVPLHFCASSKVQQLL